MSDPIHDLDLDGLLVSVLPRKDVGAVHRPGYRPKWWGDREEEPTFDWRYRRGAAENRAGVRPEAIVLPLRVALERIYETPAHGMLYTLYGPDGAPVSPHPRVAKDSLEWLRTQGFSLRCQLLWVDLDNPKTNGKKTPWTPDTLAENRALRASKSILRTAGWYYTRHGARVIQPLDRAMEPEDVERALHAWLHELTVAGITPDERCKDWTHLFLMPRVVRVDAGVASRSDSDPEMPTSAIPPPVRTLDLSDLPPVTDGDVGVRPARLVRVPPRPRRTRTIGFLPLPDAWLPFVAQVAKAIADINPTGEYRQLALCLAGWLCQRGVVQRSCVPAIVLHVIGEAASVHIPRADAFDAVHEQAGADTVARFESGEPVMGEHRLHARWPTVAHAVERALRAEHDLPASVTPTYADSIAHARDHQDVFLRSMTYGVYALASPPGVGKSYGTCAEVVARLLAGIAAKDGQSARAARLQARTSVVVPTHALALQYVKLLRQMVEVALGPGTGPAHVARVFAPASLLGHDGAPVCKYPTQARALAEAGLSTRYELCDGRQKPERACAYRDTCKAYRAQDGADTALIQVGVYPYIESLAKFAGSAGLLVLDEPPSTIVTHALTDADLAAALAFDGLGKRYASALRPVLTALRATLAKGLDGSVDVPTSVGLGIPEIEAADMLAAMHATRTPECDDACDTVLACARAALDPDTLAHGPTFAWGLIARAKVQPAFAETLRAVGRTFHTVHQVLLADAITTREPRARVWVDDHADPSSLVIKRLHEPLAQALNRGGVTLLLDGSLEATRPLYERAIHGTLHAMRADAPDGALITRTHHTVPCSRSTWFRKGVPVWDGPILNAFRVMFAWLGNIATPARRASLGGSQFRVGIISYLPIEIALRALLEPGGEELALRSGLTPDDLNAARTWRALPWDQFTWTLGHYGAIRGVNRFADADLDAIVTIGDPRPNLGDVQRDCEFLNAMDWESRADVLCCSESEQALERFRSVTRGRAGFMAHIGAVFPRYWASKPANVPRIHE